MIKNLRGFRVDYLGPTNTLGARIHIIDLRHEFDVIIKYNYSEEVEMTAKDYIESRGIKIEYAMHPSNGNKLFLFSTDFNPLKEV